MKQCFIYICNVLNVEQELRNHELKATSARIEVLKAIRNEPTAVSLSSLEADHNSIDRVTMYRTLNVLREVGLIHKIVANNGQSYYSSCAPGCNHQKPHDQHYHFTCEVCGKTECFEDILVPLPPLPTGYRLKSFNNVATGICPSCSE